MTQTLEPRDLLDPARGYVEKLREAKEATVILLAEVTKALFVALHRQIRGALERGTEARWIAFFLKEFGDLLECADESASDVEGRLRMETTLAAIREYRRKIAAIRQDVAALLAWLERPLPPIDPVNLPAPAPGKDASGYVGLGDRGSGR